MERMSRTAQEALKNRIRSELSNPMGNQTSAQNWMQNQRRSNMATFNQNEFHPEVMIQGSIGEYRDMTGGAYFDEYACGHRYDDSIIRNSFINEPGKSKGQELLQFLHNKENMQKAVIIGDILGRRGGMRRHRR